MKNKKTLIFLEIVIVILGYKYYVLKKREKQLLAQNKKDELSRELLDNRRLEHKVNDTFEEVRQLAKQNAPSFLARFKEVYPEFCEKFLHLYPDIINSEFTFCAYLKLNFSTKEIATYTFVTKKAVQARKSRIRKKFNISSEEDLYIWFNKI